MKRGKTLLNKASLHSQNFIYLLLLFIFVLLISISIAFIICIGALNQESVQSQTSLATSLQLQIEQLMQEHSRSTMPDEGIQLAENSLIVSMAQADIPFSDTEEARLLNELQQHEETNSANDSGERIIAYVGLYFSRNGELVALRNQAYAIDEANLLLFIRDGTMTEPGQYRHWLSRTEDDMPLSIVAKLILPNVYYIKAHAGKADYQISDYYRETLVGFEEYTYDRFGNYHWQDGGQKLAGLFTYDDLGEEDTGTFYFRYNGHEYISAYCTFAARQTRVAVFFRNTALESKETAVNSLLVSFFLLFVAGSACEFFLTRRTYRPLARIVSRFAPTQTGGSGEALRNDFVILENAIDQQEKLLKRTWLLRTLRGANTELYAAYQDEWLIDETEKELAVIAFRVDDIPEHEAFTEEDFEAMILEFFSGQKLSTKACWDKECLLITSDLSATSISILAEKLRTFQDMGTVYFSAFLSTPCSGVRELHRGYDEVVAALAYCASLGKYGIVLAYESIPFSRLSAESSAADFEHLKLLSDSIAGLSLETSLQRFDEIVFQASRRGAPIMKGDPFFSLLTNSIAMSFYDICLVASRRDSIGVYTNRVLSAEDIPQLRKNLEEALRALQVQASRQDDNSDRFFQIKRFVDESYRDPNLSSGMVAERFNLSSSSITRIFKQYNGTGFLEYVHHLRVKEAIHLLSTTSLTEKEIAALVGYNNVLTMIRAFKAHANTVPKSFRSADSSV